MSLTELSPGVEPNYIDPPDHKKQGIILHTVCLTLITCAILMRTYTRTYISKSFGLDDYIVIFAWALSVVWSGVLLASGNYGIGRHLWDIPPEWLIMGLKYLFVTELMYIPIALAVKLSFFICFDRIFAGNNKKVRYFIWLGIISNVVFYVVVFFYTLFLCKPIALSWNPFLEGECGPEEALPYATGIWGFLSDFYIFVLPIPCVWSLHMSMKKKIKLTAAFSVGLFACIASIVRFVFTIPLVNDLDATWNYIQLSIWAVLEVDIGIICSCLLSFPAFFRHHKPARWDSYVSLIMSYISQTRSFLSIDRSSSRRYHLQPDLNSDGGAYYNAKIGSTGDVEAFALSEREGMNIRKTTEIRNQSVAIGGYGR